MMPRPVCCAVTVLDDQRFPLDQSSTLLVFIYASRATLSTPQTITRHTLLHTPHIHHTPHTPGYISPVKTLSLPANTTFEYTFYLVLGDVGTIRAYAQQIVATAAASAAAASPSAASHPQTPLTPFESAGGESDPFDKVDYLSCYDPYMIPI